MRLGFGPIESVRNGFLDAIYDGLEATVDTLVDAVRGHKSWEALGRAEDREDRALLRAGYDPDFVIERREYLDADAQKAHVYDVCFGTLREPGGWRRADLESVLERYDNLCIVDLYNEGARPEDYGYESLPTEDFTDGRGALSLAPEDSSGALSLSPEDPNGACSLTEPEPTSDAPELGDALER